MHGWTLDACRTVVGSGVWTCGLVGVVLGVVWTVVLEILWNGIGIFAMEMRQLETPFLYFTP